MSGDDVVRGPEDDEDELAVEVAEASGRGERVADAEEERAVV
jgi:hypothetical protein